MISRRLPLLTLLALLVAMVGVNPNPLFAANEDEPLAEEIVDGDEGDLLEREILLDEEGDHDEHDEHAEDHETPPLLSLDLGSAFWNFVIFLALLGILGKFVWPNVLGGLQSREEKIRTDLESAEATNAKAQSLLQEYERKLDEASAKVQSMMAEARKDAEASGARIVEEAKEEAERQRERAVADIETAKKVAMADMAQHTTDLAMQVARSVVGRELRPEDHADLIRQSLDRLPSHSASSPSQN